MEISQFSYQQRIDIIVTSYNLAGYDTSAFEEHLHTLMGQVPLLLLELAMVEIVVRQWLKVPFERGVLFLERTYHLLALWQQGQFDSALTPFHFEMVTGLDPTPTFARLDQALQDWISEAERVRATVQMPATEMP
jgi:hypothetical protein